MNSVVVAQYWSLSAPTVQKAIQPSRNPANGERGHLNVVTSCKVGESTDPSYSSSSEARSMITSFRVFLRQK